MISAVSNETLSSALVQAVETGAYPDAEDVISSEIGPAVLPDILRELGQARQRAQLEIGQLSRDVAPNIDGWIEQAKQLQVDIERSRTTARDIVREAEEASHLRNQRDDLSTKVQLLTEEVNYSRRLEATLKQIQSVANGLTFVKDTTQEGSFDDALNALLNAEASLVTLRPYETSQSVELLIQRTAKMRKDLADNVWNQVDSLIQVDHTQSTIIVNERVVVTDPANIDKGNPSITLGSVITTCSRLKLVDAVAENLCRAIDKVILKPRLGAENSARVAKVERHGNHLRIQGDRPNGGAGDAIDDVLMIATFVHESLPLELSFSFSELFMPLVLSYLLSSWLPAWLPSSVSRTEELQTLLARVIQFSKELSVLGWTGEASLNEWVESAPRHWLSKRRESSLASVRFMLSQQTSRSKTVERVETQTLSHDDVIAPTEGSHEDWNTGWSDEESRSVKAEFTSDVSRPATDEDDETDAWDIGDDNEIMPASPSQTEPRTAERKETKVDEEGDAWGWNEGESTSTPASPIAARNPTLPPRPAQNDHGEPLQRTNTQRQVTLRESYSITLVPENLFELVATMVRDADSLRSTTYAQSPIASAAPALNTLPTLVIASYRALAPTFYNLESPIPGASNMYMYNDASYLAEQLTSFTAKHKSAIQASRMKLDADIDALHAFARRAYGREMDNQRTILRDLLDGAQGFASCTEPPFAAACADAVSQIIDRIRDVSRMWSGVLSKGALLQSLGSLLSEVISKVILDIEELGDIGENESAKLREFCTTICTLNDLFKTTSQGAEESQDMTGVYTPQWFKFQYLAEILEASLADIKYLWQQGELSLEFDKEELIDLMQALFAESDYRRRAIADIRRG